MTDDDRISEAEIEARLAALDADRVAPSQALMARIMADAAAEMPRRAGATTPPAGFWAGLAAFLGGQGALAGLSAVAALGLAIGLAVPEPVGSVVAGLGGETLTVALYPETIAFETGG